MICGKLYFECLSSLSKADYYRQIPKINIDSEVELCLQIVLKYIYVLEKVEMDM